MNNLVENFFTLALVALFPVGLQAQETADLFRDKCFGCHNIGGGKKTGPDLKDVSQRITKEGLGREWLLTFITNAQAVLQKREPYALRLRDEYKADMNVLVSREQAERLLKFIDEESKKERSDFAALKIVDRDFTPEEINIGRDYFTGRRGFKNGAPACMICHTLEDLGLLGGGRLGGDLIRVFKDKKKVFDFPAIAGWLKIPSGVTQMEEIYKRRPLEQDEIELVAAYLKEQFARGGEASAVSALNFFLLGLGGAVGSLVLFDVVWKRRFRAVRRALVHGETEGGAA